MLVNIQPRKHAMIIIIEIPSLWGGVNAQYKYQQERKYTKATYEKEMNVTQFLYVASLRSAKTNVKRVWLDEEDRSAWKQGRIPLRYAPLQKRNASLLIKTSYFEMTDIIG